MAKNLGHLMDNYQQGFETGIKPRELERAIKEKYGVKVSYQTIRRMRNPYTKESPNLSGIDYVAAFFGVNTWDLLKPQTVLLTVVNAESATHETTLTTTAKTAKQKKTNR